MAQQPENVFIDAVHRHLPTGLYRMKNHNAYNGGIPDCWYSGKVADLWVEYKFVALPARGDTLVKITLAELQKEWLRSRHKEGRQVAVIVGCKEGGVLFSGHSWDYDYRAEDFKKLMVTRQKLAEEIMEHVG